MKRVDVKAAANDAEMKMLGKTGAELAKALAEIATEGDAVETRAERMLALVRSKGIVDERTFSAAIRVAYRANGWRATRGRPKLDEKALEPVPSTVKQYVSSVRAAFRLKVDGRSMRTFSALRKAVSDARAAKRAKVRSKDPNLAGVQIKGGDRLTGAVLHDLMVVYEGVQARQREALIRRVRTLVSEFKSAASGLRLVESEKKAA